MGEFNRFQERDKQLREEMAGVSQKILEIQQELTDFIRDIQGYGKTEVLTGTKVEQKRIEETEVLTAEM